MEEPDSKLEHLINEKISPELGSSLPNNPQETNKPKFKLTREHVKGLGILASSLAAAYLLRDNQADLTDFFRSHLPWATDKKISLTIDVLTNTLLAPVGFAMANYANDREINKKELAGQIAFAAPWGAIRHYFYKMLSKYDAPTVDNIATKTGWYMPYTWFYAHLYMACSYLIHELSQGSSLKSRDTYSKLAEKLKNKSGEMLRDGRIWTNIALNLANLYLNPFVESRPTVGGLLLIHYNMSVLRHSHKDMTQGFFEYFRSIFKPRPSGA